MATESDSSLIINKRITYFSSCPAFQEVKDYKEIEVQPFLKAAEQIAKLVDLLGRIFSPVSSDIRGNITKLNNIYQSDPSTYATLYGIVKKEAETLPPEEFHIGTDALLWLKRALDYIRAFLSRFLESESHQEDLTPLFTVAYKDTLEQHHNWFVQKIFRLCLNAAPGRKSLICTLIESASSGSKEEKLSDEIAEEHIMKDLATYLDTMSANIEAINQILKEFNFEL